MKKIFTILAILWTSILIAQDFHLSQYWSSPLHLNPALTGVMNDNIRLAANYRNQWFRFTTFTTYSMSVDANLFRNKLNNNFLGLGVGFYQDIEGEGEFKNTGASLSLAYSQQFGNNKNKHYLGFGLQGAYYIKQINLKNLIYGSLFENNSNTDPIDFTNYRQTGLMDFNAGIHYFANLNNRHSIGGGFAISHIAKPNISFGNNSDDVLYRKYTANVSAKILLNNDFISITPLMLYQNQGPHQEMVLGSYVGFILNNQNNTVLYAGGQYRLSAYEENNFNSDAFILGVRAEYESLDVGFSYDITTSDLRNASTFMGGPELYVIYTIAASKSRYREMINCPKF